MFTKYVPLINITQLAKNRIEIDVDGWWTWKPDVDSDKLIQCPVESDGIMLNTTKVIPFQTLLDNSFTQARTETFIYYTLRALSPFSVGFTEQN